MLWEVSRARLLPVARGLAHRSFADILCAREANAYRSLEMRPSLFDCRSTGYRHFAFVELGCAMPERGCCQLRRSWLWHCPCLRKPSRSGAMVKLYEFEIQWPLRTWRRAWQIGPAWRARGACCSSKDVSRNRRSTRHFFVGGLREIEESGFLYGGNQAPGLTTAGQAPGA